MFLKSSRYKPSEEVIAQRFLKQAFVAVERLDSFLKSQLVSVKSSSFVLNLVLDLSERQILQHRSHWQLPELEEPSPR